jgi:hypothetical protein
VITLRLALRRYINALRVLPLLLRWARRRVALPYTLRRYITVLRVLLRLLLLLLQSVRRQLLYNRCLSNVVEVHRYVSSAAATTAVGSSADAGCCCWCCGGELVVRLCASAASHTLRGCIITLRVLRLRWTRRQALNRCCLSHPEGGASSRFECCCGGGLVVRHGAGAASHTLSGCIIALQVLLPLLLLRWARLQALCRCCLSHPEGVHHHASSAAAVGGSSSDTEQVLPLTP